MAKATRAAAAAPKKTPPAAEALKDQAVPGAPTPDPALGGAAGSDAGASDAQGKQPDPLKPEVPAAAAVSEYVCTRYVNHDNTGHEAGDPIGLTDKQAEALLEVGAITVKGE